MILRWLAGLFRVGAIDDIEIGLDNARYTIGNHSRDVYSLDRRVHQLAVDSASHDEELVQLAEASERHETMFVGASVAFRELESRVAALEASRNGRWVWTSNLSGEN